MTQYDNIVEVENFTGPRQTIHYNVVIIGNSDNIQSKEIKRCVLDPSHALVNGSKTHSGNYCMLIGDFAILFKVYSLIGFPELDKHDNKLQAHGRFLKYMENIDVVVQLNRELYTSRQNSDSTLKMIRRICDIKESKFMSVYTYINWLRVKVNDKT